VRLKGKVAVVTGSASGIGKATITRMAREGASAVVTDVNAERIKEVVREIEGAGGTAMDFKADVTKRPEVKALMEATVKRFGRIDILVNNAGVTRHKPFLDLTDEDWDFVLAVDLKGVFNCIQAAAPFMMEQRYGKIVNISSVAGIGASARGAGRANYEAAKAGVVQLTKTFARELGPYGVNVNSVAPGSVHTPMTHTGRGEDAARHLEHKSQLCVLRRIGQVEDIANAILFLASDESDFISGQTLRVDGGRTDML
jgi:NAD(P)-dependent dehydrogenase (short-subunit alcohol dehydrogenase family)